MYPSNPTPTERLAMEIIWVFFHGSFNRSHEWEIKKDLRNRAIEPYFRSRVLWITKEEVEYEPHDDEEAAHAWFSGVFKAFRKVEGDFGAEVTAVARYLETRPSTTTR